MSSKEMQVGDHVEFRSDSQTGKGPSAGLVVFKTASKVMIEHSDTAEWFTERDLNVERVTTHARTGGTLWILR